MTEQGESIPATYEGRRTAPLNRLASVATALGDTLCQQVVFIGGSILPLLETDRDVFGSVRPTKDVDAVVATATYAQKGMIEDALRTQKFRHDTSHNAHADRWRSPENLIFDLVSCGDHLGGTGNTHDRFAIETAVSLFLPPGIRHASGVGFLATKCGAYRDRGRNAPLHSKDLMDIVVLVATRPSLAEEVARTARTDIRTFLVAVAAEILDSPGAMSAIPSHIADREPLATDVETLVIQRLSAIAGRA